MCINAIQCIVSVAHIHAPFNVPPECANIHKHLCVRKSCQGYACGADCYYGYSSIPNFGLCTLYRQPCSIISIATQ